MMKEADTINKYTAKDIDENELYTDNPLAGIILATVWDLQSTDRQLNEMADRLTRIANNIKANVNAEIGDMVYSLNPSGEAGRPGVDADILITKRHQLVETLQRLVRLWFKGKEK